MTERNKRNVERISEQINEDYQKQHHFLSESPWSAQFVMQKISLDTNAMLGDFAQQCLSIDESSNAKAGKDSVGVSRQHNGNLGKVDNCQTGVYATLSKGNQVGLINTRLFLPDEWINNPEKCQKAGVPKMAMVKKSKIELALDLIRESINIGVQFGWINADGLYGSSYEFGKTIEELGKDFMVDVHKNQHVYLSKPEPFLPESKGGKGRKITKLKTIEKTIRVDEYVKCLKKNDFKEVKIRKGTKGWIKGNIHLVRVWVWNGKEEKPRERTLMIREGIKKGSSVKYCLSNIPVENRTYQQFALMQAQRHWIERAFEDGKGELGMVDYQVRKFNAWYHHQAMVMLVMLYVNKKKIQFKQDVPMLSVRDVRLQIIAILKEKGVQLEKEIEQMFERQQKRYRDILRYYPENDYF